MFKVFVLLTVVWWIPVPPLYLDKISTPVVEWEGWLGFSDSHAKDQKIIVRECVRVFRDQSTELQRKDFCEAAGHLTGRPDLCVAIRRATQKRCESAVDQNVAWYFYHAEIIYLYAEDYQVAP